MATRTAPLSAGLGLKPEHFGAALACRRPGLWFEVHPENYLVDGGPRLAWLEALRAEHPLSLHSVSLSLAGSEPPDAGRLARLAALVRRLEPALVSGHLAWSSWRGAYLPDLLPFPRSAEALAAVARNIDRVQAALACRVAIENPSHYMRLDGHEWEEVDFLAELVRRTDCLLLLDVNNVAVSAHNLGTAPQAYIDRFPAQAIAEIHLAGHSRDAALGDALWIDSHAAAVSPEVWALYERLLARTGPRPTLVERDAAIPPFAELLEERDRAAACLATTAPAPRLADFQRAFVQALLEPGATPAAFAGQPGFAVHRNTITAGCIDALEANHPVVAALGGADWFRDVAAAYARRNPPGDVCLMRYGKGFDEYLSGLTDVAGLPFLPAVALLERLWRESHMAADAVALEAASLRDMPSDSLAASRLVPHPAARWHWFEHAPALGLWRAHQAGDEVRCRAALAALEWRAEGVLLTRPRAAVLVAPASRAACAFLDACARSAPLSLALAAAAEADTDGAAFDLAALLRQLLEAGALCGVER